MNLVTFKIKTCFSSVDNFINNLTLEGISNTQEIGLVLFEILINVIEHRFSHHTKSQIYDGKASSKIESISIWLEKEKNKLECIVAYPNRPMRKSVSSLGSNGKKIIKYLSETYHHEVIGKMVYEKISFDLRQK